MDRELYDDCATRYRAPGDPPPRLMVSYGNHGWVHHVRVDAEGFLSSHRETGESFRGGEARELDAQDLAALDRALAALPEAAARCARERALFVGFFRDGAWTHLIHDRAALPEPVHAIFDTLGLPRPPVWVRKVPRRRALERGHRDFLEGMALSPGGLLATAARDGGLVRELASGAVLEELDGERWPVEAVAFAGETVAWCVPHRLHLGARAVEPEGQPGTIVGGEPGGPVIVQHRGKPKLAISPDGRLLAISYFDATSEITVFELPGLVRCARLAGHEAPVTALAFSPDSQLLASGDWSREVRLWSAATGEAPRVMLELRVLPGGVAGLAFSPDGARLAGTCAEGLWIWDVATGERLERRANIGVHLDRGCAIAWSPDGRFVADLRAGGGVIWDAATGRERGVLEVPSRPVAAAFASPTSLVVCSLEAIGVWDLTKIASP